ncbi:MAG: serine hydrolase [Cyanobacteria bacterium J06632_3]
MPPQIAPLITPLVAPLVAVCLSFTLWLWGAPLPVLAATQSVGPRVGLPSFVAETPWPRLIAQRSPSAYPPSSMVSPTEVLSRLFTEPELQRDWFADSFLAQISLAEISQITQGIVGSVGAYQSIEDVPNGFMLTFERGKVPTHVALNERGQITGLLFETPQLTGLSVEDAIAEFSALPGQVHVLATRNGVEVAAVEAEKPLAVGSTFKLLILQVLQDQIAAGQHQWDEVVSLKEDWKSLPSGFLQTWPEGSMLTLESLATLMISQSDNTATDHLLNIVGREAVEALSSRNRPFLTTREAFVLKDPANRNILRRWRRSDEKRSLISALAALPLPEVNIFNEGPQAIDVEWFFSARELCAAMENVASLPLMSVNPGLVNPDEWQKVAFKGGSEPGVENFTTYLVDEQGPLCVTATWNNEAGIDELKFSTLYRSLIESLRGESSEST